MENGLVFYIPAAVLLVAVALKYSSLHGEWRDPLITASAALLLVGSLACFLAAPPTIRVVNDATGISNFSAPLVYSSMSALSASYLVLMMYWQGGPAARLRRNTRLVVGVYTLVIAGIVVLFALAEVPVERARDLDTYYANTPYMREMILIYLVGHSAASVSLSVLGINWLRKVRGLTRGGLTLIVVGVAFDVAFQLAKYTAMAARWRGSDWDWLSTSFAPPLVLLAGICVGSGFALPRVGPLVAAKATAWLRYFQLRPLCVELAGLGAPPVTAVVRWWDGPTVRLAQQEVLIGDGVLACAPYFDRRVHRDAYAQAAAGSGPAERRPQAVADAAMLSAARVRAAADHEAALPAEVGRLSPLENPDRMADLARALSSPVVARARAEAAAQTERERSAGRRG